MNCDSHLIYEKWLFNIFQEVNASNLDYIRNWRRELNNIISKSLNNDKIDLLLYWISGKLHHEDRGVLKEIKNEIVYLNKLNIKQLKQKFEYLRTQSSLNEKKIKNLYKNIHHIAYNNLLNLSELEYKLSQVKRFQYSNLQPTVILDIEIKLNKLCDWLIQFMLAIIETRTLAENGEELLASRIKGNMKFFNKETKESMGKPWEGIKKALYMLHNAKTLQQKIIAITLSLNVWHDNGGIFGDYGENCSVWCYAIFNPSEFETLNNKLNTRKLDSELSEEVY
jgi:hypothetical protein